jgi:hypothetical protein
MGKDAEWGRRLTWSSDIDDKKASHTIHGRSQQTRGELWRFSYNLTSSPTGDYRCTVSCKHAVHEPISAEYMECHKQRRRKIMTTSDTIAAVAAGAALMSLILSSIALLMSGRAQSTTKNIARRQGVIELYKAWEGVNDIDPTKPITPDIVKAANATSLTASLWNHDVIEKQILLQSYWPAYKDIYDSLSKMDGLIPGKKVSGRSLLSSEITKVYEEMKKMELDSVRQTRI